MTLRQLPNSRNNEIPSDSLRLIAMANSEGGDQYVVEQRTDLKKTLASLRLALAKTTAPERSELLKKLERIKS
jgi:hypothetical protein